MTLPTPSLEITVDLALAWLAGSLIGIERSYHGRAAGFRTHGLVALAAAGAVIISFEPSVLPGVLPGVQGLRFDPSRIVQGVMTGIGFLGAGVIFKEGVNVQGLTTAAAIWAASSVGMLFGLGMVYPGVATTAAVMITLVAFRWIEERIPWQVYALAVFRFEAGKAPDRPALAALLRAHGVTLDEVSYKLIQGGEVYEYSGSIKARGEGALEALATYLRGAPGVVEFELSRIGR